MPGDKPMKASWSLPEMTDDEIKSSGTRRGRSGTAEEAATSSAPQARRPRLAAGAKEEAGKGEGKGEVEAEKVSNKKGRRKKGGKGMQPSQEWQTLVTKTCLNLSQSIRELEGSLYVFILLPIALEVASNMKKAAQVYGAAVRTKGKGHSMGPPHIHVFAALLSSLMTADIGAKNKELLGNFQQHLA